MVIERWSGNLLIDEIETKVDAVLSFDRTEWHGKGEILTLEDAKTLLKNLDTVYETKIGKLLINQIDPFNRTFSFKGTSEPLF